MLVDLDNVLLQIQPDSVNWESPRELGRDGLGSPVRVPYWSCRLGFGVVTIVDYTRLHSAWVDCGLHYITLPHPATGITTRYQGYITGFTPRLSPRYSTCDSAMLGVDVTISKLSVI